MSFPISAKEEAWPIFIIFQRDKTPQPSAEQNDDLKREVVDTVGGSSTSGFCSRSTPSPPSKCLATVVPSCPEAQVEEESSPKGIRQECPPSKLSRGRGKNKSRFEVKEELPDCSGLDRTQAGSEEKTTVFDSMSKKNWIAVTGPAVVEKEDPDDIDDMMSELRAALKSASTPKPSNKSDDYETRRLDMVDQVNKYWDWL